MRSLSVQIQPERSPGLDMAGPVSLFEALTRRTDLVRHHAFDRGVGSCPYYNFTFGTDRPADLWQLMLEEVFLSDAHAPHLARSAMVMCSGSQGWSEYAQLWHWDPDVPIVAGTDL